MILHPFDFCTDAYMLKKRNQFRRWLQNIPYPEYFLICRPPYCFARQVSNVLTSCERPDHHTYAEYRRRPRRYRHAMHFVSLSGRTCLVVPVRPYAHIGCFARQASAAEFRDLVLLTADIARASPGAKIETHGTDVGWLHVRITCPEGGCPFE